MNSTIKIWISRLCGGLITAALVPTATMKITQAPREFAARRYMEL